MPPSAIFVRAPSVEVALLNLAVSIRNIKCRANLEQLGQFWETENVRSEDFWDL